MRLQEGRDATVWPMRSINLPGVQRLIAWHRLTLARRAARRGDWMEAINCYSRLASTARMTAAQLVQFGHAAKESGDLPRAESLYRRAVVTAPTAFIAHRELGRFLKEARQPAQAIESLVIAACIAPMDKHVRGDLRELGVYGEQLERHMLAAVVGLPRQQRRSGLLDLPVEAAYLHLARRAARRRRWALAAARYRRVVAVNGERLFPALVQLGHAHREMGDFAVAEQYYRQAILQEPRQAEGFLHIGHIFKLQRRSMLAQQAYRIAWLLEPSRPEAREELYAFGFGRQAMRLLFELAWEGVDPANMNVEVSGSSIPARGQHLFATATRLQRRMSSLNYVLTGHMLWIYSLAIINRAIARALERGHPDHVRYLPVETHPIDHADGVPADERPLMELLMQRGPRPGASEIVISQHYPILVPEGDYRLALALFAWEESHVDSQTVERLNSGFDGVIAPSRFVAKALMDSGLRIPVAAIGQPSDLGYLQNVGVRRAVAKPGQEPFTFLHLSSCFPRKGVDVLLRAWSRAFTRSDPVRLIIKTFPNPHNDVEEQVAALLGRCPSCAEIRIVNRDMTRMEIAGLYEEADCAVLPSRGEGYNLPALEAMLAGIPLIVTGHGGHRDFCGPKEARLVDYRLERSASHVRGQFSMWAEPNEGDLVDALRELVNRHSRADVRRRRALRRARTAANDDAWVVRLDRYVAALIDQESRERPRLAWIGTWDVACGIAEYSKSIVDLLDSRAAENMLILCDTRTRVAPGVQNRLVQPVWAITDPGDFQGVRPAIEAHGSNIVVIQHQDGLMWWGELADLLRSDELTSRVTVAVLHNPRTLAHLERRVLQDVVAGLGHATRLIVHNVDDVNFLKSQGLTENVTLLPHGANTSKSLAKPRLLLDPEGRPIQDGPIIGCHGFFLPHKGIDKLIAAAGLLKEQWPGLRLRLVNARFHEQKSEQAIALARAAAREAGMEDAIEWHTQFLPKNEIEQLLAGCDLIVLPYGQSDESASGAVRIALASLVPLVATKVHIFSDLGDAAAWAEDNRPEILAAVIDPVLRSLPKRERLAQASREWLHEHDWVNVARILNGMFEGLLHEHRLINLGVVTSRDRSDG